MARPIFWMALAAVAIAALVTIGLIQIIGNDIGESCRDSYSCRGFIIGGAECLRERGEQYCSRYCDRDDECPAGWTCEQATPTALTIETSFLDGVCFKPR